LIVVESALKFFRVMAYIVGVMLLLLCAAMVAKYGFGNSTPVAVVGPVHGFLYMIYLVAALHLGLKTRWPIGYLLLVLLAGTIPFLSFVVERNVTDRVRRQIAAAPAG
jgi:integral membrane protein